MNCYFPSNLASLFFFYLARIVPAVIPLQRKGYYVAFKERQKVLLVCHRSTLQLQGRRFSFFEIVAKCVSVDSATQILVANTMGEERVNKILPPPSNMSYFEFSKQGYNTKLWL